MNATTRFAALVKTNIAEMGVRKVYIADLAAHMETPVAQLKDALIACNREGTLRLSRSDLCTDAQRATVLASQITVQVGPITASFHMVAA